MQLRPYQLDAIQNLRISLAQGKKSPLLQAATGAGKTVIAAYIIQSAVEKGNRVLFVVDSLELVDQAVETFERFGMHVGVLQGYHEKTNTAAMVQVCTAQTIAARLKKYRHQFEQWEIGLVIIDEAHVRYKAHSQMREIYPCPFLGLSATPFAKGMGKFFDDLTVAIPMRQLIDDGYLCPFRVYAPSQPDMDGVKTDSKGDYKSDEAAKKYTQEITADIISTWLRLAGDRQTIGFACNVAHSKLLASQFQDYGIKAVHVDGYGSSDEANLERHKAIEGYKSGEIQVLWNVAIATKGFDAPHTSCIIDARPTKSLMLHFQKFGRGLRIAEGKQDCVILDHAGNVQRNGFPTDHIITALDDGESGNAKDRKIKTDPLPKPCSQCGFVKEPKQHKCPECGFAPEKMPNVGVKDGELIELTDGKNRSPEYTVAQKREWMLMLKHIEQSKGYKKGWSIYAYKSKFGVEPATLWPRSTVEPSPEVQNFVTHMRIKHAKGKKKREVRNAA